MAYRVTMENGVVMIEVQGAWPVNEATAAQEESGRLVREHGARKLLIDLSGAQFVVDTLLLYDFVPTHARAFPPGTRHAVVLPGTLTGNPDIRFGETVAENSGVFMRHFATREEALAWLAGGDSRA